MPVEFVAGDVFASGLPAVAHGCNCAGSMEGGIAAQFARRYPAMEAEYRQRCAAGRFQLGDVMVWQEGETTIFNLATQRRPGPDANLSAVQTALHRAIEIAEEQGIPAIGLPRIGAGIGGLPWPDVREVIAGCGSATAVRLVVFEEFRPGVPPVS